ncbi:MAG TPA: metal ABC transporter permease [Actinomycetes bacterium]|nr:metal ABC transporter permease [Actinomycetes bacterium]
MPLEFLQYDFMQRALIASILVGLAAPSVGIFLVQRRLALMGDGMGHVALTGVALGLLLGWAPVGVALVAAASGAVIIELLRSRGRTTSDLALAIMFYGGIAGGVVLIAKAPGASALSLNQYLFGAITTTSPRDLAVFAVLSAVVLALTLGLARHLFAVSNDEEFATASGLPVVQLNLLLAVLTATTVVVSMRIVGLLLISALMVVPVATAQLFARSFRATMAYALAIGLGCAVVGVSTSYYTNTPSGGSIVLTAIAVFTIAAVITAVVRTRTKMSRPQELRAQEQGFSS